MRKQEHGIADLSSAISTSNCLKAHLTFPMQTVNKLCLILTYCHGFV